MARAARLEVTEPIRTARLVLRSFRADDLEDLYAIQSRPDVTRYLYWDVRTRPEVASVLEKRTLASGIRAEGDGLALAVTLGEEGPVIGDLSVTLVSERHQQAEIGFLFHPDHHGRGFATEGARALLDLAFGGLGAHRVCGRLDARNTPSGRVLQKLGMRREGHLVENERVKGEWTDEVIYGMLAREWQEMGEAERSGDEGH